MGRGGCGYLNISTSPPDNLGFAEKVASEAAGHGSLEQVVAGENARFPSFSEGDDASPPAPIRPAIADVQAVYNSLRP